MSKTKLKKILALFLAAVMLATSSTQIPVFAESIQDSKIVSENEIIPDSELISDNKTVSEEGLLSENQIVSDNTVSQEEALAGTVNSLNIPVGEVKVQSGSYNADISIDINSIDHYANNFRIIYTDTESKLPTENELSTIDSTNWSYVSKYNVEEDYWGKKIFFNMKGIPSSTTMYYQLFYLHNSIYYKITQPASFTTKGAITQSKVSFADFTVKELGYTTARVEFQVVNPDDENVIGERFYVTDGTKEYSASEIVDEKGNLIPDRYQATVFLGKDQSKDFKPEVKVYTGDLVETPIAGTPVTITASASSNLQTTCTPNGFVKSAVMKIKLDPYYPVDSTNMNLEITYKSKDSGIIRTNNSVITSSETSISLLYLMEKTEYEYTLNIYDKMHNLVKECTGTFQTGGEDHLYTVSDLDGQIFNKIRKDLNISSNTIKQSELEKITTLTITSQDVTTPVQSLKGVDHLINLYYLQITGQNVTSASEIEHLSSLEHVNLSGNKLTEMPDLSELVNIPSTRYLYFNYNFISPNSLTTEKLPDCSDDKTKWVTETQREQMENKKQCITADTYYALGEKHPFLLEADNFPTERNYTLTVSVNGVENKLETNNTRGVMCYSFPDLGIVTGTYPVTIRLTDRYGEKQMEETRTIQFVGDEGVMRDAYADAADDQVSVAGYIPGNSKVTKILLKNAQGDVVGKDLEKISRVNDFRDYRYDEIISRISSFGDIKWSSMEISATVKFSKELTAGDYHLVITTENGKEYSFTNIVHISAKAVIKKMDTDGYQENWYDITGEYFYLNLKGVNINPQKVWPEIRAKDGTVISEKGSVVHYENNSYQYQLKKIQKDTYWKNGNTFNVTIESENGYEFVDDRKIKSIIFYFEEKSHVLSEYYNYRASRNKYRVHFDSNVTDGTKVNMELFSYPNSGTQLAVAEGTVKNGWVNLNLKDLEGKEFILDRSKIYGKKIVYTEKYKGRERNISHVNWYGYDEVPVLASLNVQDFAIRTTDSASFDFSIILPNQTDKTLPFEAYLGKTPNSKQGEPVTMTAHGTTKSGKKCVKLTGKRTSTALSSGRYYLNIYCKDTLASVSQVDVYNNDLFYIDDMFAYGSSSGEYVVQICSGQLLGEYKKVYHSNVSNADALKLVKNSYTLEIHDLLGNEINGWSVNSASYKEGIICITLKGIPADYRGCYVNVLSRKKTNTKGYILDGTDSTYFYEQKYGYLHPEYGYYTSKCTTPLFFQQSMVQDNESKVWSSCESIEIGERPGMLPVTVKFYKVGENTLVKTLTINKYGKNRFTSSELLGISPTEVYFMTAESADQKQFINMTGYVGGVTFSTDITETETTLLLDRTSISMQEGETAKLNATPSSTTEETLSWSSSNPKVATVENGTVTAIGAGTAIITASLSGGTSATCQIVVTGKSVSDAADLAGTTIKAVKKQTYTGQMITPNLTVMNGKVPLVENADYILSYRNNKNAGTNTAVAVIYGIGEYKGTKEITFTIAPKAIKGASIEAYGVIAKSVAQSPSVIVMDNGKRLTEGVDYHITDLKNNKKAGTGKFSIVGINNYTGKKLGSFQIYPANTKILTGWSISAGIPNEGYTYDGIKKTPVMTVKDSSGAVLHLGKDYTVSYKNNVNAGTAIAIVKGKGSNKGIKDYYFKIKPLNVSTETTIDEITAVNYVGGTVSPKVVVKSKAGKKLKFNKDYTLTYSNNYQASAITGAKTAAVVITGTGNYSGTVTKDFLINKIVLGKGFAVKELKTQTYTGKELTPTFKLYYKKRLLKLGQDYTVTYKKNVEVGKGEIVITAAENSSFTGSMTTTFKIK